MRIYNFMIIKFFILCTVFHFSYKADSIFAYQQSSSIVDKQGKVVCSNLLELLKITKIDHDGSLQDIVEKTQALWLRQPGKERWEMNLKDWGVDSTAIIKFFDALHMIEMIEPEREKYEHVCWMGAAYPCLEHRLEYLIFLWNKGVRFNSFVILSGARPLTNSEVISVKNKYGIEVKTEAECMKLVYDKIAMPKDMSAMPVTFINVPMLTNLDGSLRRPTTADTIEFWLKYKPKQGDVLIISNQPYVCYQEAVVKALLPEGFNVEGVGAKSDHTKIDVYLDNLARFLYQEKNRLHL